MNKPQDTVLHAHKRLINVANYWLVKTMRCQCLLAASCLLLVFNATIVSASKDRQIPTEATPQEKKLGEKAIKEFEKNQKLVENPQQLEQLRSIVKKIIPLTDRPKLQYTVKVVDEPVPNAFTFPGGFIYVTSGLLDRIQSDHELAGVLAHEIAHNVHLHHLRMREKANQLTPGAMLVLLGSVAAGTPEAGIVAYGIMESVLLGYTRDMEREADELAFQIMQQAGYDPVGLLTFFETLNRLELQQGIDPRFRYYAQTHPAVDERIVEVIRWLKAQGTSINRRTATGRLRVTFEETIVNSVKTAIVTVGGTPFCALAPSNSMTATARAEKVATTMTRFLSQGARRYDYTLHRRNGRVFVDCKNSPVIEVTPMDAALHKTTPQKLGQKWMAGLTTIFLRERIEGFPHGT